VAWVNQAKKAVLFQRFPASGKPQWRSPSMSPAAL
jgi:hypothetical protein